MDDQTRPDPHYEAQSGSAPPAPSKRSWPRRLLLLVGLLVVVGAGIAYWLHARHFETTDDAFIDGYISQVSPQIAGRVIGLTVRDNQAVTQGELLVQIDPRDAQTRLDQVAAQRDQAQAELEQARATLPQRQADLDQALANIRVSQSDLSQNQRDLARYSAINPRAITAQTLDQSRATVTGAQARLEASRQAAAGMRAQLAVARTQVDSAQAALRTADSNVAQARLQLSYTRVVAPAAGFVARRTVNLGDYVNVGQALLAVVQPECWVTANLKESQLARLRPGQPARIDVDAFPDGPLAAHVESVQRGTGSVFSSLPAENATGNYVKIVQRLPIKLVFDDGGVCGRLKLAPGMSVEPRITVR